MLDHKKLTVVIVLIFLQMASLPLSRNGTYTSTDSENSDTDNVMLEQCSLQEIRQEDLAAILPDQQDCDAFGEFECRVDKNSTQTGDASGSDMELPQQAVNALIQRTTESSSESESHAPPNPSTLYANSLLKQFVTQTQLLNAPCAMLPDGNVNVQNQNSESVNSHERVSNGISSKDNMKRKRGRPKKGNLHSKRKQSSIISKPATGRCCSVNPNVSPDSGIQNSPDHTSSPEPCPSPNTKAKHVRDTDIKRTVQTEKSSLPKSKQSLNNKCSSTGSIGLTGKLKEQNKLPVTSNRFDRLLYANADRVLYPPRRKAGRPPITRKGPGRPPKHKNIEQTKSDNEKSNQTTVSDVKKTEKNNCRISKAKKVTNHRDKEISGSLVLENTSKINGVVKETTAKKAKSKLLHDICERVSKRLELNNRYLCQKELNNGVKQDSGSKSSKSSSRRHKSVLDNKLKLNNIKAQYTTLKNAKLMHSKHKHKKHKKCKFKILKPLSAATPETKINIDMEKLIADFVKSCCISSSKPAKENIPEILKTLKKVSKKRKTSEYNDRKKKKQTISSVLNKEANSNEQRLPLKKRHYHLSAGSETKPDTPEPTNNDEIKTKTITNKNPLPSNMKAPVKALTPANTVASPKGSPTGAAKYIPVIKTVLTTPPKLTTINNNEYESVNTKSESVDCHIDEAIEACITRFSEEAVKKTAKSEVVIPVDNKTPAVTPITTTTPKKRHRLEQQNDVKQEVQLPTTVSEKEADSSKVKTKASLESVVNELKMKRNLTCKVIEKKPDAVAQIMTRKKNRLEDLTSTLVTKITPSVTENTETLKRRKDNCKMEEVGRDSVIKYPACKKVKPSDTEKLDFIDAKPTGIFMPSTDLEILIPINTIELKKETVEATKTIKKYEDLQTETVVVKTTPKAATKQSDLSKKKMRKRRAINRTGFPTVKKKKKKMVTPETPASKTVDESKLEECDRVPKVGEDYSKFVQRTEKSYSPPETPQKGCSDVSLPTSSDIENMKWEGLSECDSLPQEERTEIEQDDFPRLDFKHERVCRKQRDISPSTSIDTVSDNSKIKASVFDNIKEDLDELPLEMRIQRIEMKAKSEKARKKREMLLKKRKHRENMFLRKRKLRDISPASSVEQFLEKRLREERASASSDEFRRSKKIPRWRKRYLVAGLFSDYYKEDE